ncbi:MAG: hypothetical protein K0S29_1009 [Gammaproteobacteria bacterium]|jgi:hypothetical protein|nr:hypothetical protein [Gammaproteobacteria bacterium]
MTEHILNDFKLLTAGHLANYRGCSVTEIFLFEKNGPVKIAYINVCFQETVDEPQAKLITSKRIKIKSNSNLGIKKYFLPMQAASDLFHGLLDKKSWHGNKNDTKAQEIHGDWHPLTKQFVPSDDPVLVPLNNILKNNFFNGSYIIEFFDNSKQQLNGLIEDDKTFLNLTERVYDHIPIKLATLPDRLGNIIFQFPVLSIASSFARHTNQFGLTIRTHDKLNRNLAHVAIDENEEDQGVFDNFGMILSNSQQTQVDINTGKIKRTSFLTYDLGSNLIVDAKAKSVFLESISCKIIPILGSSRALERRFKTSDGCEHGVNLIADIGSSFNVGSQDDIYQARKTWSRKRHYDMQLKDLEELYLFKRFKNGQRKEALEFIRKIIEKYGKTSVDIWDPYCSAKDIMDILFFNPHPSSRMRALADYTCIRGLKENHNADDFIVWKNDQVNILQNNILTNHYLKLDYKARRGDIDRLFHDRFLICQQEPGAKPLVWSLGASLNGVGKAHHIITQVKHAQLILDDFNELWGELTSDKYLVWSA